MPAAKQLLLGFMEGRNFSLDSAINSWKASTDMCSWKGVRCDDDGRLKQL